MELRNLKNEIINENGVCTIKTETTFSDCVVGDGIILAMSKERKQLIKYTSNLDIISVEPLSYVSMQEYRFKNLIFLVFEGSSIMPEVMMISKGKAEWIKLGICKTNTFDQKIKCIYQVHPKKYIIITTERYQDRYVRYRNEIISEIDVNTKQAKTMFGFNVDTKNYWHNYNHKNSPRFIFYHAYAHIDKVYDLYTGFCYKIPDIFIEHEESIIQSYSSKEIIVLQIKQKYHQEKFYLYINGYLVYQYASEEYDSVLYNLRNKITKYSHELKNHDKEYFFTLPIGKGLCIWKKNEKPEIITLV